VGVIRDMGSREQAAGPMVYQFGVFELDPAAQELRRRGSRLRVHPQPMRLLTLLVERAGDTITREQLCQAVWGDDVHVDFSQSLNACVRQARVVLSDEADVPRYIETVPRIGYRFIAPVTVRGASGQTLLSPRPNEAAVAEAGAAPRKWMRWSFVAAILLLVTTVGAGLWLSRNRTLAANHDGEAMPGGRGTVAASSEIRLLVLPFRNLTNDRQQEYISDGITEEMITQLGRLDPKNIGVIARTSSMAYKNSAKGIDAIADEMKVQYVLEGSVRHSGSLVRVSSQLIKCSNQTQLWAQDYDIDLRRESLLNVESDISMQVAAALDVYLNSDTATAVEPADRRAHDAYLLGLHALNSRTPDSIREAIHDFKTAIQADPNYSPAYAGIAQAYALNVEYSAQSKDEAMRAADAARRAIKLDPASSQALTALAFVEWRFAWNSRQAEQDFQKAVVLAPDNAQAHHWYALFLASQRRFGDAREQLRLAMEFDPASLIIQTNTGWLAALAGDGNEARQRYQRVLALNPNFVPALTKLAWLNESEGKLSESADLRVRACQILGDDPNGCRALGDVLTREGGLKVYQKFLEHDATNPFLNAFERARFLTLLGERQKALHVLRDGVYARDPWMVFLSVEPVFGVYRSSNDPQFASLLKQTGF
jgi:TolB-like protein/DNA-binding winged helix-turn-helix (wHTH) protein/Tfp pilus assembly protein PilF